MSNKKQLSKPVTLPWTDYAPYGQAFCCPDCGHAHTEGGIASYHSVLSKHQAPVLKPLSVSEQKLRVAFNIGTVLLREVSELKKYIEVLEGRLAKKEKIGKATRGKKLHT